MKTTKSKTLFVRNVGNDIARFSLNCSSKAFSATPNCAELKVQEAVQITIDFKPSLLIEYSEDLRNGSTHITVRMYSMLYNAHRLVT